MISLGELPQSYRVPDGFEETRLSIASLQCSRHTGQPSTRCRALLSPLIGPSCTARLRDNRTCRPTFRDKCELLCATPGNRIARKHDRWSCSDRKVARSTAQLLDAISDDHGLAWMARPVGLAYRHPDPGLWGGIREEEQSPS